MTFDPELPRGFQDADFEQAELEAAGRDYSRRIRLYRKRLAAGDLSGAAQACPHGGGYPLNALAAAYGNDPREGESGIRCDTCYSVLSGWPWDGPVTVLHPCETRPDKRKD